jgi:hypothetical protein
MGLVEEAHLEKWFAVLVELKLRAGRIAHVAEKLLEDRGVGVVLSHFRLLFEPKAAATPPAAERMAREAREA